MSAYDWALVVSALMLAVAATLVLVRMTVGPTVLDRAIALDVVVAVALVGLALEAARDRATDAVPALLVLTLLGFTGSVSIARFINPRDVDDEEDE